jgi:hypothetical protein
MKSQSASIIRPTRSKTRKGVIAWLAKYNPFMNKRALNASDYVAVHVNKHTGAIVYYECPNGTLIPVSPLAKAA